MSIAYVDTSYLIPIAFAQPGAAGIARRLGEFDNLVSSTLLEAELSAACAGERATPPRDILAAISLIVPDRPLSGEIAKVLRAGAVSGSDCAHLATALYVGDPRDLHFLSLDPAQSAVAKDLGFRTQFSGS